MPLGFVLRCVNLLVHAACAAQEDGCRLMSGSCLGRAAHSTLCHSQEDSHPHAKLRGSHRTTLMAQVPGGPRCLEGRSKHCPQEVISRTFPNSTTHPLGCEATRGVVDSSDMALLFQERLRLPFPAQMKPFLSQIPKPSH